MSNISLGTFVSACQAYMLVAASFSFATSMFHQMNLTGLFGNNEFVVYGTLAGCFLFFRKFSTETVLELLVVMQLLLSVVLSRVWYNLAPSSSWHMHVSLNILQPIFWFSSETNGMSGSKVVQVVYITQNDGIMHASACRA